MDSVISSIGKLATEFGLRGFQTYVAVAGEVVTDSASGLDGVGSALRPSAALPLFCTMKPVLAYAVVKELGDQVRTMTVGELALVPEPLGEIPLRDLLSHQAGLPRPSGRQQMLVSKEDRLAQIAHFAQAIPRSSYRSAYSEAAAWHLLHACLVGVTGDAHAAGVSHAECSYLAAEDHPSLDLRPPAERHPKFGWRPVLGATDPDFFRRNNPAFGGCASARWLGEWATDHLLTDTGRMMAEPTRIRTYDHVLDRECSFGLGLMVHLDGHDFGNLLSAEAVGHSGYRGQSFFVVEPAKAVVISFVSATVVEDDEMVRRFRQALVERVLRLV